MNYLDLIKSLIPLNPGRRFAVAKMPSGQVSAIAIDRTGGGWDMFAASYFCGKWVECLIPSIQDRDEWEEVIL